MLKDISIVCSSLLHFRILSFNVFAIRKMQLIFSFFCKICKIFSFHKYNINTWQEQKVTTVQV